MKSFFLWMALASFSAGYCQNPYTPKPELSTAIKKLGFMEGSWKGSGWIQMGPQKHSFNQTEKISAKLNNTLLQIDGEGRDSQTPDRVIHQAFAIVTYDTEAKLYKMKAYRGDGGQIDAWAKLLDDHTFQWGFSLPMTGSIRYTISVQNGKWKETGEMSRDEEKTWFNYFEMNLQKE